MKTIDILIIDDDKDLSLITRDVLMDYGYSVNCAHSINQAYQQMERTKYKLLILDINLPDGNGFSFCEDIRKVNEVPILFISARTSSTDKISALEKGGDDYLSKPYQLQELLARVNAQMRRNYKMNKGNYLSNGSLKMDVQARIVKKGKEELDLTLREFDVLKYLMENKGKVIHKEVLFAAVWGSSSEVDSTTLTVHIRWLREKIELEPKKPQYIITVWGIGYQMENIDE